MLCILPAFLCTHLSGVIKMPRMYPIQIQPSLKFFTENLKDLFTVRYSEEGCNRRQVEEQTWIHFCDFLDDCEGNSGTSE